MSRRVGIGIGLAGLAIAGVITYAWVERGDTAPTLDTRPVTRGDIVESVDATGTLQAVTTVQVGTQVSGIIRELNADFNSRVRRGDVIARLEPSLFQAQVDQERATVARLEADAQRANVSLEDAQTKLKRARDLSAQQLIPAQDLDTAGVNVKQAESAVKAAQAQIVQARASLNQAEVNLTHTVITAPIDGVVISRNVDVGQTVAASMQAPTLFVIARDLADMQVAASIAESDIGRIKNKQPVSFRVDAFPNRTYKGTVSQVRLQPVVDQNVVSYVTIISVPNPDMTLKPGMTANVTVEVARAVDALRVPNAALRMRPTPDVLSAVGQHAPDARQQSRGGITDDEGEDGEGPSPSTDAAPDSGKRDQVWTVTDGQLQRVPLRTGISDGVNTAVLSGALDEGTQVLTGITTAAAQSGGPATSPLLPFGNRFPGGGRGGGGGGGRPQGARGGGRQ
jgi:HlyD family secretion protein